MLRLGLRSITAATRQFSPAFTRRQPLTSIFPFGSRGFSSSSNVSIPAGIKPNDPAEYTTTDGLFEKSRADRSNSSDPSGRTFNYLLIGSTHMLYASLVRATVIKALATLSASSDVLALAKIEFDLSAVPQGEAVTVKWRGKPIFIRHRTPAEIEAAQRDDNADLRDKQPDSARVKKPQYLILLGVCTHLGCVPINKAGNYNGWFCPCHGSHYDTSGRIRLGPAPLNLEVPEYSFITDTKVVIG